MNLVRLFSADTFKGTEGYLKSQTVYEGVRTLLLFAISGVMFLTGYFQTGSTANLLTIVAVLGFLPASKSLVSFIMFVRYKGCSRETAAEITKHLGSLTNLYDCVFTSYKVNYEIHHLTIVGNTICGYTASSDFKEADFQKHLTDLLKLDGIKDVSVKIFTQLDKYTNRLEQLQELQADESITPAIVTTIKNITL